MPNKGRSFPADIFNNEELDRFFDTFGESYTHRRNRLIFRLALRGQLRCSEILDLRVSDIDTKRQTILVRKGKGNKRRVIGIDTNTCRELDTWMTTRAHNENDILFASHRGHPLDTSYVRKLAHRHGILAKIGRRVAPHLFRHSGACHLAGEGVDIRIVSKQLGHSNSAVTSRYIDHLRPDEVIDRVSRVQW